MRDQFYAMARSAPLPHLSLSLGRTQSGARPWRVLPPNSPIWCSLRCAPDGAAPFGVTRV
jgi:hypothetical protein